MQPQSPDAAILVIEDDLAIARLLEALLASAGYRVRCAQDGRSGLAVVRSERPDLILLDLTLPQMDGWQVLESLRAYERTPPVVLLTGHTRIAARAKSAGAAAVVIKPFDVDELLNTVEQLLSSER